MCFSKSLVYSDLYHQLPEDLKDIYFSEEYYKLAESNGEGSFHYFHYSDKNQHAVYPFLKNPINGFNEIPDDMYFDIQSAYGYCGVITNSYDSEFINAFYKEFNLFCTTERIIAEFVRFHPFLGNENFSSSLMQKLVDRKTVAIDLSIDYDEIFRSQYSSKGRNMIRKARKLGYRTEFVLNPTIELIEVFHQIYSENMRRVNASEFYFFSLDYFTTLFNRMGKNAYLALVYNNEDEIVCASIFLHHSKYLHYHLSGRNQKADNSVNNFIIDEAVQFGIKVGASRFHLGGGLSDDEKDHLFRFKSSFSKDRCDFFIGKRVHNQEVYDTVVKEWEEKNQDKIDVYKNHLLKYRF